MTFVPPARLLHGRVNTRRTPDHVELLIDQDCGVHPAALPPLLDHIRTAAEQLPTVRISGVHPVVTVHQDDEPQIATGVELSPYLITIYLPRGSMPTDVADELAANIGYALRHT
jgi:hypothetical protein